MVFAIPPAAGKATAENITQSPNAKPIEGQPGTFAVGPSTYKRLANYLLMAEGGPDSVAAIKDDPFANDYKASGTIALVSLNLAIARASAPEQFKGYVNQLESGMPPLPGTAQVKSGLDSFIASHDRVALALARDDKDNLHLKNWIVPVDLAGAHKFPQPAFPADCIFQTHIVYPNAEAAGWLGRLLAQAPNALATKKPELEPKIRDATARAAKLLTGADAVSIAVEVKDGKARGYIVTQYAEPFDAAKEFAAVAAIVNDIVKAEDASQSAAVSTYAAAGGAPPSPASASSRTARPTPASISSNPAKPSPSPSPKMTASMSKPLPPCRPRAKSPRYARASSISPTLSMPPKPPTAPRYLSSNSPHCTPPSTARGSRGSPRLTNPANTS